MRVIFNNVIPFKGFSAINICGVMFARTGTVVDDTLLRHESIHTAQMKEMWYVGFYLLYILEWLWRMAEGRSAHDAYRAIRFEKEAYAEEQDITYLDNRKPFAWRYGK